MPQAGQLTSTKQEGSKMKEQPPQSRNQLKYNPGRSRNREDEDEDKVGVVRMTDGRHGNESRK